MTPTITPTRMTAWLEQAWLVRYLDRRLASEEVSWFEAYVLDKPELLAMIEADTRLRDALAAGASVRHMERSADVVGRPGGATAPGRNDPQQDGFDPGESGETDLADSGAEARPIRSDRWPFKVRESSAPAWLPLAAALLAGVGVGAVGTRWVEPGTPALAGSPARIVYDTMRGEAAPPRVENAGSASPYVLLEAAVPPGAEAVTMTIAGLPAQALPVSADGFVSLLAERAALRGAPQLKYNLRTGAGTRPVAVELALPAL